MKRHRTFSSKHNTIQNPKDFDLIAYSLYLRKKKGILLIIIKENLFHQLHHQQNMNQILHIYLILKNIII